MRLTYRNTQNYTARESGGVCVYCLPGDYVRNIFHRAFVDLSASPCLVLVGHWPPGDSRAADNGNDCRYRGYRSCAVVHIHLRTNWKRHSGAIRPAEPAGNSRALSICPKSDVHRSCAGPRRGGDILRVNFALGLQRYFSSRFPFLCGFVRGTHAPANIWDRV